MFYKIKYISGYETQTHDGVNKYLYVSKGIRRSLTFTVIKTTKQKTELYTSYRHSHGYSYVCYNNNGVTAR